MTGRYDGSRTVNDSIGKWNLKNTDVAYARIGVPLVMWEYKNDNNDANSINWKGFQTKFMYTKNEFKLQKQLYDKGIPLMMSVFDAPAYMVENPEQRRFKKIKENMYPELVESVVAWLLHLKNEYHVKVKLLGFNEVDGGWARIHMTAQENAKLVKMFGERLEKEGLETRMIAGETASMHSVESLEYIKDVIEDQAAKPYIDYIGYHSWKTYNDNRYIEIGELAEKEGLAVVCSELGYDPEGWKQSEIFDTWEHARKYARLYFQVIYLSRADIITYWQYMNDYPLVKSGSLTPYKKWYVVKHFTANFTPGTQIVEGSATKDNIYFLAGKREKENVFVLNILNIVKKSDRFVDQTVKITGLPNTRLTLTMTNENAQRKEIGIIKPVNGKFTLILKGDSLYTLKGSIK
jgi:O-glycosyl hydrolase